jgi:DNA-binding SARP family transcriptional activator
LNRAKPGTAAGKARGYVAAPLFFKLLGDVRFQAAGRDATPRSKRARALVAYLALSRDASATRARLADLFWGDRGEAQARGSLRQCLLEVRSAIGPAADEQLVASRESVALAPGWSSDVAEIEALVARAEPDAVAEALERAGQQRLMGGLYVSDAFDEWLAVTAANFDRRLADAARQALDLAIENNETEAGRRIADTYLLRDPADEEVTALAMLADIQRGAAPVAHRRFQRLRDHLAAELGAVPGKVALDALASAKAAQSEDAASAREPKAPANDASGPPLIIVGPFEEVGIAGDVHHLGGGVREEVVSALSRFRDLRLLIEDRAPQAGEDGIFGGNGHAYVLTATLRRVGSTLRVTPVLTRLADRGVVWSHQIATEIAELQAAIDTIVDRIIGAIMPRLERDSVPKRASNALYDRFLVARHKSYHAADLAEAMAAEAELEAIIAEAPDMAVAYAPLIRLYNICYGYKIAGIDSEPRRTKAYRLAQTALSIDRSHSHSYTVMGWCHLWRNEASAAEYCLNKAAELNPYHSERLKEVCFGNIFLGNLEAAERYITRSLSLEPLPNDNFFEDIGFINLVKGNFSKAKEYFDIIISPTIFATLYRAISQNELQHGNNKQKKDSKDHFLHSLSNIWSKDSQLNIDSAIRWINSQLPFQQLSMRHSFNAMLRSFLNL